MSITLLQSRTLALGLFASTGAAASLFAKGPLGAFCLGMLTQLILTSVLRFSLFGLQGYG